MSTLNGPLVRLILSVAHIPSLEYTPAKKSIYLCSISCYNQNPGTEKVLKCSTPILGYREYKVPHSSRLSWQRQSP